MKPPDTALARKVRRWLDHADEDLRLARHAFSLTGIPPYRLIAYHAQQCRVEIAERVRRTVRDALSEDGFTGSDGTQSGPLT